ncbi:hypothetical protein, partial [Methyloversatilis sp.]|uniref:hypothetical protein n=1 Tax=Methyloversatilis sp. TaxID=2569862 RepID=UPI002736930A
MEIAVVAIVLGFAALTPTYGDWSPVGYPPLDRRRCGGATVIAVVPIVLGIASLTPTYGGWSPVGYPPFDRRRCGGAT